MSQFGLQFKNRNFLCLWLAQIISQFGDRINQMALIGLIAGRTPGSAFQLAKLLSFTIIPVFILGPVAGVYVDRWDRKTTLFVCDFLRGLLVLTIPFVFISRHSMVPIYIVVFLSFCLSRFYVPAKMAILPNLVEQKDLLIANSLVTTTGIIAFALGCALGGFIVERLGSAGGFICDAITFFISGVLVLSISSRLKLGFNTSNLLNTSREMIRVIKKSVLQEIKDGIAYLVNHREIRFIVGMLFIIFAAAGSIYVVIIVFIQEAFNTVTRDLGILAVFLGIGLFLGAVGYGRLGRKVRAFKVIFSCLILGGLMVGIFSVVVRQMPNLIAAGPLALLLGVISGPMIIAANTVILQVSDDNMRGKVFSSLEVVMHFAFLATMLMSGFLAEYIENFWILVVAGAIFMMVGLIGFLTYKEKAVSVGGLPV